MPISKDDRTIDRRISDAFDDLTDGERRLAQVVRQAQGALSAFTAGELAARAGVSNATAARFFRRLGYAAYGDARRQSRDQQPWASPEAELGGMATATGEQGSFAAHIAHDCRNLARTVQAIPDAELRRATDILVQASAVHVVGFRNSMALATYARAVLIQVRPEVSLLPLAGMTFAEELANFKEGQALLALGFRRRPLILREIMRVAEQGGLPTVLIADDSAAITAQIAAVTLRCHNLGGGMFDSYAAAISVINYLANAVGLAKEVATKERLRRIEELHARLGSFGAAPVRGKRPRLHPR